jgi:hypothetical protein
MNPHSRTNDNKYKNSHDTRIKSRAAVIRTAGILVAAAVLSGLSLITGYYQPAIAQQNMTGTNATTTTTTPPSTTGADSSACAPTTQNGAGGAGQNATTNATTTTGGGGGNLTQENATAGTNATNAAAGTGAGNQSILEVRMHIEQACTAAQNNDIQGVLTNLTLALNALANVTAPTADGEEEPDVEDEAGGGEEGEGQ